MVLYSWLTFFGFKLASFNYDQYHIKGLYLKLDKKLIVDIDQLNIEGKDTKFDLGNLKQDILSIPYFLKYFQSINLKSINFDDEIYSLYFSKNRFIIDSKELKINTTPNFFGHTIELNLENIFIKKYNLNLNGKLTINIFKNEAYYLGDITYKKNRLNLNIQSTLENIDFYVQSANLNSIKFIKDFISLDKSIENWLYHNVQGIHKIDHLIFRYDIVRNKIINDSIELNTNIKDATIQFNDKLSHVDAKNVNIKFKKDNLYFEFDQPKYKSVALNNSTLKITNITNSNKKSMLLLDLYTDSILNDDIHEILSGYDIFIPVKQNSGALDTNILISLDLQTDQVDIKGKIDLDNAQVLVGNLPLNVSDAKVYIDNSKVNISSSNTLLFDKQLDLNIKEFSIDTENSIASGSLLINRFLVKNNSSTILDLKNKPTLIRLDFKDDIKINLPQLNCIVNSGLDKTSIKINSIKQLVQSSQILKDNQIKDANLSLVFQDDDNISFVSTILEHNSPLVIGTIDLIGTIKKDNLKILNKKENILIESKNSNTTIKIDGIDVDKSKLPTNFTDIDKKGQSLTFIGKNSNIIIDKEKNKILPANKFIYKTTPNKSEFYLNFKNTNLDFVTQNGSSSINIKAIDKEFLSRFLGNDKFITDGQINISGKTIKKDNNVFKGEIDLKDTNLKDFAALNQLIILIQSSSAVANPILALPTLFRIVKGDITFNGYKVLKGKIKYTYNHKHEFLNLYDIKTTGSEIDFDGNAKIDLKKRIIDSKIKVIFLKDITLIAEKLPIINKVFLDEQKRISSEVSIYGDLENPKSKFLLLK